MLYSMQVLVVSPGGAAVHSSKYACLPNDEHEMSRLILASSHTVCLGIECLRAVPGSPPHLPTNPFFSFLSYDHSFFLNSP